MANVYHVNPETGRANICRATEKRGCLYRTETGEVVPHFSSAEEARKHYEQSMENELIQEPESAAPRYSFLKNFQKLEEEFEADFDGVPNRFFNADLRGNIYPQELTDDELISREEIDNKRRQRNLELTIERLEEIQGRRALESTTARMLEEAREELRANKPLSLEELQAKQNSYLDRFNRGYSYTKLGQRLTAAVSAPADLKMDQEKAKELAESIGLNNFQEVTDSKTLTALGADGGYFATLPNGGQVFIASGNLGGKNLAKYSFRGSEAREPFVGRSFVQMDLRTLAGNERIRRLTGVDVVAKSLDATLVESGTTRDSKEELARKRELSKTNTETARADILKAMRALEEKQQTGKNFKSQQKYFRSQRGSIATAFDDKKNPKDSHIAAAKSSSLAKHFKKIEIDGDVDLEEFKRFESDYAKIADKLPEIPADRRPDFRVRYLGKHRATGLYSAGHNAIAIDVRDSGSTIHELGHYYDIAVKENASLSSEFSSMVRDYSRTIKVPAGAGGKYGPEYYSTPTEVFARGFELYASERLGVENNSLLREGKLDRFDYEPITSNPSLKKRMFDFFDRTLKSKEQG